MKAKVTSSGVLVPRKFLKGVKEVEIKRQNGLILVVPVSDKDPIFNIGQSPVKAGVTDASVHHDKYIYDS